MATCMLSRRRQRAVRTCTDGPCRSARTPPAHARDVATHIVGPHVSPTLTPVTMMMHTLARLTALTVTISGAVSRAPMTPTSTDTAVTTVRVAMPAGDSVAMMAVLDSAAAGWNRGDLAAYLSIYVADATTMSATGPVRGVGAIGDQMRSGFWKAGRPLQQLHFEHVEMQPLGADHALVVGEFVLAGAERPARRGWFTTVWTRAPEGWRIVHDRS